MCDGCNQVQARRGPLEGMPSSRARGSWRMLTPRPCGRCIYRVQPISAGLTCAAGALGRARAGGAQGSAAPRAARPPGPHGLAARRLVRAWPRPVRLPAPASPRATRSVLAPCCLLNWGRDRVLQALGCSGVVRPRMRARPADTAQKEVARRARQAQRGDQRGARPSAAGSAGRVRVGRGPAAAARGAAHVPGAPARAGTSRALGQLHSPSPHPPLTLISPSSHPHLTLLSPSSYPYP